VPLQQFDVCQLPDDSLAIVLQSDMIAPSKARIVAPLIRSDRLDPIIRDLNPAVWVSEAEYRIALQGLSALRLGQLRGPVCSLSSAREAIIRGLDLLFTGV
jgi:CcdB protein